MQIVSTMSPFEARRPWEVRSQFKPVPAPGDLWPRDSVELSTQPTDVTNLEEQVPEDEIYQTMNRAFLSDDLSLLNSIDKFRQSLPPELQCEYDRRLQQLRDDSRIQFSYRKGEKILPNPAVEDMILRGLLAATFSRPDLLDRALRRNEDGILQIEITNTRNANPRDDDPENGVKLADGDINISIPGMVSRLSQGLDVAAHEFWHAIQGEGEMPVDATEEFENQFNELYQQAYGEEGRGQDDQVHWFVYAAWDFHYYPEALKQRSPELYELMVGYFGFDPVAGELTEIDPRLSLEAWPDLKPAGSAVDSGLRVAAARTAAGGR
jgi:hypothetical protein